VEIPAFDATELVLFQSTLGPAVRAPRPACALSAVTDVRLNAPREQVDETLPCRRQRPITQ
jgi:hypothetical protein